ncbi:MAG: acetyl-CoA synthase subunit gamma [Nitrospirae bacterium]|nr:acetyl-CoA synthase subunit gamma [Nitrospirota bacterium]
MPELKLKVELDWKKEAVSCCECGGPALHPALEWVIGTVMTPVGPVPRISSTLSKTDYWEHFKCRTTAYRDDYRVVPGLYAAGNPDNNSDVLVSANYKYSFDMLRRELKDLNAWILVLDTKGINVWCAAGKGTFGTAELAKRISVAQLNKVVDHRRVIVPQLGAPGVSAFRVKRSAGFDVLYGPVHAKDIPAYIKAGYEATREMRRVKFPLSDRLVLTPMEINPAMKKFPLYAGFILVVFGLAPSGILFRDAFAGGLPFLLLGLVSVLAGALLTPALLPFVPFRSFAIKGWITGLLAISLSTRFILFPGQYNTLLLIFTYLFFPMASSYIALQFTGSTTFTGMSGVKKELRIAIPAYLLFSVVSFILLTMFKLTQWGIL